MFFEKLFLLIIIVFTQSSVIIFILGDFIFILVNLAIITSLIPHFCNFIDFIFNKLLSVQLSKYFNKYNKDS